MHMMMMHQVRDVKASTSRGCLDGAPRSPWGDAAGMSPRSRSRSSEADHPAGLELRERNFIGPNIKSQVSQLGENRRLMVWRGVLETARSFCLAPEPEVRVQMSQYKLVISKAGSAEKLGR
jgi:hypothetical protein